VFVDGCFWHGCPEHFRQPATNSGFWHDKIARNRSRDVRVTRALTDAGWKVLRFWEHEIRGNTRECADQVRDLLAQHRAMTGVVFRRD
jgi:DNA mismatch endonuclease (patch repair protein)